MISKKTIFVFMSNLEALLVVASARQFWKLFCAFKQRSTRHWSIVVQHKTSFALSRAFFTRK